ncbi:M1 family metallopeptidase [Catalinimonas alkaloidigena]|nr:M1 family metallopeptidase [Catalinimonas alkaloidigena]
MRRCYDVTYYDLQVQVDPAQQTITGSNEIFFRATEPFQVMQVDLFQNMEVDAITFHEAEVTFQRDGNALLVELPHAVPAGQQAALRIAYHGRPTEAIKPPWDGGFVWASDGQGKPWIAVACEGAGASLWWPNKDHLSDEPDSMQISLDVPSGLKAVANGRLRRQTSLSDGYTRFEWFVGYPINNYNVTLNIADYTELTDAYVSHDGDTLALNYYVLPPHATRAREHFQQVKPMLAIYEKLFGKYPFWDDGYALVETPYWGMEHQSAVAYGNEFENLPHWNFDYIIVHESGHEYWGNSVSCRDHGEMWIHESFCTYAEALYVEARFGYDASVTYLQERLDVYPIANREPMLGPLEVNYTGWNDADMYYKGAWMLHTLRNVIGHDSLWFETLYGLAQHFRYQTVTTEQVIGYMEQHLGCDLSAFFDQYLRHPSPPQFVYKVDRAGHRVRYQWKADAEGFHMPLRVRTKGGVWQTLTPTQTWQEFVPAKPAKSGLEIDTQSFYVTSDKK